MAACDSSLRPLFETSLAENNLNLIESLSSWKTQIVEPSSFTEIFGELYFKEKTTLLDKSASSSSSSSSSSPPPEKNKRTIIENQQSSATMDSLLGSSNERRGLSLINTSLVTPPKSTSESLLSCTEGLGFESSDDVEISKNESGRNWEGAREEEEKRGQGKRGNGFGMSWPNGKLSMRTGSTYGGRGGKFPPPISCLGGGGKPWIFFKSYKGDGRFVLREIRVPTQEFLQASREDGRLKLHLVQQDDDATDGHEAEETDEEEEVEEEEQLRKEDDV